MATVDPKRDDGSITKASGPKSTTMESTRMSPNRHHHDQAQLQTSQGSACLAMTRCRPARHDCLPRELSRVESETRHPQRIPKFFCRFLTRGHRSTRSHSRRSAIRSKSTPARVESIVDKRHKKGLNHKRTKLGHTREPDVRSETLQRNPTEQ
jgi:hypothetical protein